MRGTRNWRGGWLGWLVVPIITSLPVPSCGYHWPDRLSDKACLVFSVPSMREAYTEKAA